MTLAKIAALLIFASSPALAQEAGKPQPKPEAKEPAKAESVVSIQKSNKPAPCVIKPVMTDDELRACGARISK